MDYRYCLNNIISRRIQYLTHKYVLTSTDKDKKRAQIEACKQCVGRNPKQLYKLLERSRIRANQAWMFKDNYWYYRSFELEVEEICRQVAAEFPESELKILAPMRLSSA